MKRVLIVDDSKVMQKLVGACVTALGAQVAGTASDGEEGVEVYKQLRPDLVLLDITMPNKDGRECLKDILKVDPRATIVMLSALNTESVVADCLGLGAKAFIDKPSANQQETLKQALQSFLKAA